MTLSMVYNCNVEMIEKKSYRYPGVQPFRTQDSDIFFGRDDDMSRLYKLIMLEKLVVLFGKSGQGKSSLISAGIIPMLNDLKASQRFHYSPIEVRIGKVAGHDDSPVEKVILKLNEQFPEITGSTLHDKYENVPELWGQFKKLQLAGHSKFLLIFDQFEEFFNYSREIQEAFRWELSELLYTDIPQVIRENSNDTVDKEIELLSTRLEIKVLISIRSDRLSLIHSMKDALPRILDNRFEIKGLNHDQAIEAIKFPALLEDDKFATHPFSYDDIATEIILKELTKIQSDGSETIEAFHLQIICQGCESRMEEKRKKGQIDREVNKEDLPDFSNLYDEYYRRQIEKLPAGVRENAQSLLEDNLIDEDEQTREYRRLSVDGNILRKQISKLKMDAGILQLLENSFLIRRELNNVGGFSYEISHDTIVIPIMKIKEQRNIQEIKATTVKKIVEKIRKQITWLVFFLILLLAVWKWKVIYFGTIMLTTGDTKPVIRLNDELNTVVKNQKIEIKAETKKFDINYNMGSWTASQLMMGLANDFTDTVKENYLKLTSASIVDSCCCWVEFVNYDDMRASSWIISAIGSLNMLNKYHCKLLDFLIQHQLENGAWSMLPIEKKLTEFSSTYATCHVIRALHNALPNIDNPITRNIINTSIDKGAKWLLANRSDTSKTVWEDYPNDKRKQAQESLSISGLVVHTLNLTHYASTSINRQWLNDLPLYQSATPIFFRQQNDVFYYLNSKNTSLATTRDGTRHLVIPWQIIAIVDAYKDGSFAEKLNANMWLDNAINNLNYKEIKNNQIFMQAEIFIALRYLQDKNYVFQ